MGLRAYIIKRVLQIPPTILVIMLLNFTLLHLGGDPAYVLAGVDASEEYIEAVRERYGLNKPFYEQLFIYMSMVLHGDLGYSWRTNRPAIDVIMEKVPNTILLVLSGQILGIVIGISSGIFVARKYPSKIETTISTISLVLSSIPIFWFGLMMLIMFSVYIDLFPISGMITVTEKLTGIDYILDLLWHLVLPVITMAAAWLIPIYQRITTSSILEVMREDYIVTAKAKGLSEQQIFVKHALRNALLPTISIIGLYIGLMFSGAILTESIFTWPGIGRLMLESTMSRDFPVLMGIFLMVSICVIIATLITDIIYAIVDPRIRY